jgi:hypothetical protein
MKDNRYSEFKIQLDQTKKLSKKDILFMVSNQDKYDKSELSKLGLFTMHRGLTLNNLNIFIDSIELFDFLFNLSVKDYKIIDCFSNQYAQDQFKNQQVIYDIDNNLPNIKKKYNMKRLRMTIHHKKTHYSYYYEVHFNSDENKVDFINIHDGRYNSYFNLCLEKHKEINKDVALIFNILHYINAFPECLQNSVPNEICNHNHYSGIKRKLTTHPSIIDRSGVTPHFRQGHFRYLDDDRFVNKKGQTVLVSPCFVKGEAKTVLDNKKYAL